MKIKSDKLDILFSKLVRGRAEWCCEFSGEYFPEDNRRGIECCHIFGRARKGLRWHPMNAVALSTGRHMYFTAHPIEFVEWIEAKLGPEEYSKLRIMAAETYRVTQPILADIHSNLKASLKQMEMDRAAGVTGYLDFESPYPT